MEFLNNINWFIKAEPKTATNKETFKNLTKKEFDKIVFDDNSTKENVKIAFPLNENYLFFVTREIQRPVSVKQLLTFIYKFYQEKLDHKIMHKAFEEMEEWMEEVIDFYNGDITKLSNFDVFTDTCEPDFCGLELNEETGEYVIGIGPE
jgi:hypothetical protein